MRGHYTDVSNSYPKKNSSYAYSNNNGATVVYNTEALIKSDSYYFNINNYDTNYHMQLNKFIFTKIKKKQYVII